MSSKAARWGTPESRALNTIVLLSFLALGMMNSGVPRYLRLELGADRTWTGLGTTIYFVGAILVRPSAGRWIDRRGSRWFLVWPPILIGVCALGLLAVHEVWWVASLRLLQGAIGSGFTTAAFIAATNLAPPGRQASAVSRVSVVIYIGFIVGPLITDVLVEFGYVALFGVIAALFVAASTAARAATAASGALNSGPRLEPEVVIGQPNRARQRAFQPAVWVPGLGTMMASFLFAAIAAFHPEYADQIGISRPGTLFATYAAAVLVMRRFVGDLADRIGPLLVAMPGMFVAAIGASLLAVSSTPWLSYVAIAVTGVGAGVTFPALTADAVRRVDASERGSAMGSFMAMGDVGQATAGPLVGVLSTALGFRWVYGVPAVAVGLGGAVLAADMLDRLGGRRSRQLTGDPSHGA